MLRFLGFLTGSALTAALALAIVDPVTLESLRRSAATLFLGVDPAAPAETQTAQPTLNDDAERIPASAMADIRAARSRLLAALPARRQPPGRAAGTSSTAGPDAATSQPPAEAGVAGTDPSAAAGDASGREPAIDPGAASSAAESANASERVAGLAPTPVADPSVDASGASTDLRSGGPPPGESTMPDGWPDELGEVESGDPVAGSFDAGPDPAAALDAAGDDAGAIAGASAQTATDDSPQIPAAATPSFAESPPTNPAGMTPTDDAGSDLGTLPPPPGAVGVGGWHAFWTPFHSEASATGFARHLERATGESYRVVRTGPGAYRVAFWHEGDDERSRRLLAIEQASGLSLRGGTL